MKEMSHLKYLWTRIKSLSNILLGSDVALFTRYSLKAEYTKSWQTYIQSDTKVGIEFHVESNTIINNTRINCISYSYNCKPTFALPFICISLTAHDDCCKGL